MNANRHNSTIAHRFRALVLGLLVAVPAASGAAELTVFAAASLTEAMDRIIDGFERRTGQSAVVVLAASSALARQIQSGAPADLFVSASPDWMDALQASGHVKPGTRVDVAGNRLVLVTADPEPAPVALAPGSDLDGLLNGGWLAMALVDAVPAGIYGRTALVSLGLWDSIAARVAQTDNVRTAMALVASGEARLGIVYATDARADSRLRVLGVFPPDSHPPVVYPAAAIAGRDHPETAAFLKFLESEQALEIFDSLGFTRPEPG